MKARPVTTRQAPHHVRDEQARGIPVQVPESLMGFLLLQLAWSRGLRAWLDEYVPGTVWIRRNVFQMEEISGLVTLPAELMKVRSLENLATAILGAGDALPEELNEAIEVAQARYLGSLWAQFEPKGP